MRKNKVAAKENQPRGANRAWMVFAFWGPIAAAVAGIAWSVSAYFMVREKCRMQVELAHLKVEMNKTQVELARLEMEAND